MSDFDRIPDELKQLRQWVCWREEERDGKTTKVPINARSLSGAKASSTDQSTWSSFAKAVKSAADRGYDGIGFVFTKDDPYIGIDLDADYQETFDQHPIDVVEAMGTYAEFSPSGVGIHIIGRGHTPDGKGHHPKGIGIFAHSRFFTMTGKPFSNTMYHDIVHIQGHIDHYWDTWFPTRTVATPPPVSLSLDDEDVLAKLRSSKSASKFAALFDNGDTSLNNGNASEADLALCSMLSFYTQDPAQIDRLFRASRRYRDKWERGDYREMTISRALERSEYYTPPVNDAVGFRIVRNGQHETHADPETGEIPESDEDAAPKHRDIVVYNTTDKGNSLRIVDFAGDRLRYVPKWGTWLVWDGTRWAPDAMNAAMELAKACVETIYAEADRIPNEDHAKKVRSWAQTSESGQRLREMLGLASSDPRIAVAHDALDADPMLLNVRNGTVDLRTGTLRPHRQGDLITKIAPVTYDPNADCPRWDRFLSEIMARRGSLVDFLQRAVGYSLTGDVTERKMFILHGGGRNGKSTFLNTVRDLLGTYAMRSPNELLIARRGDRNIPADVAQLTGIRFTFVSETGELDRLDESKVKDLVSGDELSARLMRENWFTFTPTHKLWAGTNHKPTVRSSDDAIWDRIRLIPFDVRVPEDQVDRSLADALRHELPGILNWAIRGCLAWQRHGLTAPTAITEATAAYRSTMDTLGQFIAEECVLRELSSETVAALYAAYTAWAEANGERPITKKMLTMQLADRGVSSKRSGRTNVYTYHGIRLRTSLDGDADLDTPEATAWATETN
jgi:putative DNA primase/helicase